MTDNTKWRAWATQHPELLAVLNSYWNDGDEDERALVATLLGMEESACPGASLPMDLITMVLRHLGPIKNDRGRGRPRDWETENTALTALWDRGEIPPSNRALAAEIAKLKGGKTENVRRALRRRK